MKEITFNIAGVQHHQMHKVINELVIGDKLDLQPDPNNEFDKNAIEIHAISVEGEPVMCGFVPRKFSAEVAALFQMGKHLECVISDLNPDGKPWEWCTICIREV